MIYRDYLKDKYQSTAVKFANAEGVPCVLEKSKGRNIRNYEVYGNSVQDGTPTPESPVEIQSVGDLTTKNLLPYPFSETTITRYGVTFTDNGDGSVTVNGTATANAIWYFYKDTKNLINGLKVGDTITVSIDYDKTWALSPMTMYIVCNYYNSEATMKDGNCTINWVNKYKTITIRDDWVGIGFYVVVYKGQTVDNITLRAQIELGSTATEYEPYHKYDIPITVTGKNMFNIPDFIEFYEPYMSYATEYGYYDEVNRECLRIYGGINAAGRALVYMENSFKENTAYTFSLDCYDVFGSNGIYGITISLRYTDGVKQSLLIDKREDKVWKHYSITSNPDKTVQGITVSYGTGMAYSYLKNIQIEEASTENFYEPYITPVQTDIYLDEPLRKVGDYADYIDFKNQKVVRNTAQTTFNGSETWVKTGDVLSGVYQGFAIPNWVSGTPSADLKCLSDKFPYSSVAKKNIVQVRPSEYSLRIIIGSEYVPDLEVATFKNWLSDNNVTITYPIETPTEESISLPALKTFKGTSIISVGTEIQPSNIKAKYAKA